jgi:DNA-binding CsgD family transcriptional regulator
MSLSAGMTFDPPGLSESALSPNLHTQLRAVRSLGVRLSGRRPVVMALDACAPSNTSLAGLALSLGAMSPRCAAIAVWDLGQRRFAVVLRGGASDEAAELLWVLMPGIVRRGATALGARMLRRRQLLTPLEEHVMDLLAVGLAVPEIATRLSRSRHTIHDHVKSLHRKIGVNSRAELVARAMGRIPAELRDGAEPRLGLGHVLGRQQQYP